jgi:3-methyladenine DNA glycosylase/8-oxoguanine DNA glycosylase
VRQNETALSTLRGLEDHAMLPPSQEAIVRDLMIAILAVNQYSVERASEVVERFDEVGLADPAHVMRLDESAIAERLEQAGYQRGDYMCRLMAKRILSAATALANGISAIAECEQRGDIHSLRSRLLAIHGVGPKVVSGYCALRKLT